MTLQRTTEVDHSRFLRMVSFWLTVILFIKLGGFFTWSNNIAITRVIKVISRIAMTSSIWWLYRVIIKRGAVASFGWQHSLSPLLYSAYLLLGFVSITWSTDPGYSGLQWFMDFEGLVFCYYFIACFILLDHFFAGSMVKMYQVVGNAVMMMISIFLVGMYVDPDTFYRLTHGGEEARLGGFIMNPNELGMLCAVGVSCFIFNFYRQHRVVWTIVKIGLLMWAIVLTGSRSSTIGCLLIAFFHIRQSSNTRLKLMMYAGAVLAVPVAVEKLLIKENGGGLDEVMSMTGRLPFWTALITEGLPRAPFFGFGFMRIAKTDYFQGEHVFTYAAKMTHNTFIQVLMNLGFVGFTIVFFQLLFTIRGFLQVAEREKSLICVGILIPIMINSFTEFGIFGETNYGILFYQLLIFYISLSVNPRLTPGERLYLRRRRPELVGA
ncbi:ligase-like O-antigen [Fibrella aestuarina BUZ 2]|uniref:Ligase-like O-antigen n=1 Tax=Fibrella aestuarina BUZ 2 TaxID=1166018 RepID=I0KF50_9BACT|nr:O-antigen ligase family protein [Fibrella aestuarina]CCH02753.1 ligase-like O-antigen [Fibrella aestuarina BUZ 2]